MNKKLKLLFLIVSIMLGVSFGDAAAATFASIAKVGDYVTYNPTDQSVDLTALTGIAQDPLNPSATTQWRILSNDGTNVEIISADSIGDVVFVNECFAMVDKGVFQILSGSYEEYFESLQNYADYVKLLNDISAEYGNAGMSTGRALGYVEGSSAEQITPPNGSDHDNFGFPYTDTYYQADVNVLIKNNMLHSSGLVWVASRYCEDVNTGYSAKMLAINTTGSIEEAQLPMLQQHSNGAFMCVPNASMGIVVGIRPVVKLNMNVSFTGSGTQGSPFVIGEVTTKPDTGIGAITWKWDTSEQLTKSILVEVQDGKEIIIDWGDGSTDTYGAGENKPIHTYATAGIYEVTISSDTVSVLSVANKGIIELDVSGASVLETLYCYNNRIKELDVTANLNLKELLVYGNSDLELNLGNVEVKDLYMSYNNQNAINQNARTRKNYIDVSGNGRVDYEGKDTFDIVPGDDSTIGEITVYGQTFQGGQEKYSFGPTDNEVKLFVNFVVTDGYESVTPNAPVLAGTMQPVMYKTESG